MFKKTAATKKKAGGKTKHYTYGKGCKYSKKGEGKGFPESQCDCKVESSFNYGEWRW